MSLSDIQQLLANARQQHQRSNLVDAEALYRQILAAAAKCTAPCSQSIQCGLPDDRV
jgi:hypothetical protein